MDQENSPEEEPAATDEKEGKTAGAFFILALTFGIAFGLAVDNLAVGIALGMMAGILLAAAKKKEEESKESVSQETRNPDE